jgi:hypothetical protein
MLVRRHRSTGELAYYRCYATTPTTLAALVRVAGRRWTVEENFQTGKGCTGLDQHQVRTWTSWYRWTTLVMLGHLLLVAATLTARAQPCPEGLIRLSLNETRRHLIRTILPSQLQLADADAWSVWRRRHQHLAQQAHYQRQTQREP